MPVDLPAPRPPRSPERRGEPVRPVRPPVSGLPEPRVVRVGDGHPPLRVFPLGLACCAVEVLAATEEGLPGPAAACSPDEPAAGTTGDDPTGAATAGDVLVVAGTVTEAMAPVVRAAYEAMDAPRYVLSFGSCSNTGGPYWDSLTVVAGVERLLRVDVFVPGCPPRPQALLDGLALLQERAVPRAVG